MNRVEISGYLTDSIKEKNSMVYGDIAVKNPYKQDDINYIPYRAFSHNATYLKKYAKKGQFCEIVGNLKVDILQENNVQKKYIYVSVEQINLFNNSAIKDNSNDNENNSDYDNNNNSNNNKGDDYDIRF